MIYISILSLGVKYVEILKISRKFLGNFRNLINQRNNDMHIDPKPRDEIYGNFRNFSEIPEILVIDNNSDRYKY